MALDSGLAKTINTESFKNDSINIDKQNMTQQEEHDDIANIKTENYEKKNGQNYYAVTFASREMTAAEKRELSYAKQYLEHIFLTETDENIKNLFQVVYNNHFLDEDKSLKKYLRFKFDNSIGLSDKRKKLYKGVRFDTIFNGFNYHKNLEDAQKESKLIHETLGVPTTVYQVGYWAPFNVIKNQVPDSQKKIDYDMNIVMKYNYKRKEQEDIEFEKRTEDNVNKTKEETKKQKEINDNADAEGIDLTLPPTADDSGYKSKVFSVEVLNEEEAAKDGELVISDSNVTVKNNNNNVSNEVIVINDKGNGNT